MTRKAWIALTRAVSPNIDRCELTHLQREPIDVDRAREQHEAYCNLLASLGCGIIRLPELPDCPDAVFVEDVAVVLDELAIVTRIGAESRREETASVASALEEFRPMNRIETPGTMRLSSRSFERERRTSIAGYHPLCARLISNVISAPRFLDKDGSWPIV